MKNKIEIYFILYLGLLMAFFGIDSEVVDYQKNQEKLLAQAVIGRLDNLVTLGKYEKIPNDDNVKFIIPLNGDYDPTKFEGNLVFTNQNNSESKIITDLNQTETFNIFSAVISNDKLQNDPYRVSINYETKPIVNESIYSRLMEQFESEEIVDKLIEKIEKQSNVNGELDMALVYNKNEVDEKAVFKITPQNIGKDLNVNGIAGAKAVITFIVSGIKNNSDYKVQINDNDVKRYGIVIKKDKDVGLLRLIVNRFKKGNLAVSAKRNTDGTASNTSRLKFNVKKPEWKTMPSDEIYVGDSFDFDGTLKGIDSPADKNRYSFDITGTPFNSLLKESGWPTFSLEGSKFKSPGNFSIQLRLDGNKISQMIHKVRIKKIPTPTITYKVKGNKVTVIATAYGSKNKVKNLLFNGGIIAGTASSSIENFDGHRHSITRTAELYCSNDGFAEVDVEIGYTYGDKRLVKIEKLLCGR